jgi:hypothetical protein
MSQINDERFYQDNVPNEVKERILLEHQVNERMKQFGLEPMELRGFTEYFLRRLTQMNDEQFKDWLFK